MSSQDEIDELRSRQGLLDSIDPNYHADRLQGIFNSTAADISIERVLDGLRSAAEQYPTGLGEANSAQIEFGPAVNTVSDPANLLVDGTLQINVAGLYRLKISTTYGRDGTPGESELRFRALVNGTQTGQSIGVELDNNRIIIPYSDEAWLDLPAGINITYEVMRDSLGSNSGGLKRAEITAGTAPNWNPCTCAAIRVERLTKRV